MRTFHSRKTIHSPKKFVLRLPPSVHEKIFLTAKQHRRSMNAEIIHHLEQLLPLSSTDETQLASAGTDLADEKHCLTLLRTLPSHKRSALIMLLENVNS